MLRCGRHSNTFYTLWQTLKHILHLIHYQGHRATLFETAAGDLTIHKEIHLLVPTMLVKDGYHAEGQTYASPPIRIREGG
jgi:hypothetical protein